MSLWFHRATVLSASHFDRSGRRGCAVYQRSVQRFLIFLKTQKILFLFVRSVFVLDSVSFVLVLVHTAMWYQAHFLFPLVRLDHSLRPKGTQILRRSEGRH